MNARAPLDDAARFERLGLLMNEMMLKFTPAKRDRMMQQHLAAAMNPTQRFEALGGMMGFVISQLQTRSEDPSHE